MTEAAVDGTRAWTARSHCELTKRVPAEPLITVSDWDLISRKKASRTRHHHGYKRSMADAGTSRVRARQVVLRLVHGAIRQAP